MNITQISFSTGRSICFGMILALTLLVGCGPQESTEQQPDSEKSEAVSDSDSNPDSDSVANTKPESTKKTDSSAKTDSSSEPDSNAKSASKPAGNMKSMKPMAQVDPSTITFKDDVKSNVELPKGLDEVAFVDTDGNRVAVADYLGKKNIVLIFTEGFNGMLCPFCKTQTSRFVANYPKFTEQDTEVLVVYPGARDHLDEFIQAALTTEKNQVDAVPFPIVLDEDFKATNFFDIKSMHAHPSTYLIDKQGKVRLAYVGADMTADRPSVKAILDKIKSVNSDR